GRCNGGRDNAREHGDRDRSHRRQSARIMRDNSANARWPLSAATSHLEHFGDRPKTALVIKRSNPEVGYLPDDVYKTFSFSQVIKAGTTLYLSGVAPLTTRDGTLELVGEGNPRAQLEWVLEVIQRCLASEGATFHNWVAQTVYTTNLAALEAVADAFRHVMG